MIPIQPVRLAPQATRRAAVRPVSPVAPVRPVARPVGVLQRSHEPQQLSFDFRPAPSTTPGGR